MKGGILMSTKDILRQERDESTRQGFQVYNEIFDEEGDIYLELEGFHFEVASSGSLSAMNGKPRLVVRLPREWAQKIGLLEKMRERPIPSDGTKEWCPLALAATVGLSPNRK
jgi:hypothetical protein